jgi:hypothetical protein
MKKILFIVILILLYPVSVFSGEVITDFDNSTLPVLNNELRDLEISNQIKDAGKLDLQNKTIENVANPTNSTDGVNKAYVDTQIAAIPAQVGFGTWASKSANTAYLAATDGIVHAYGISSITAYSDANATPVTQRAGGGDYSTSVTMGVKKGHYWNITSADTVWWLPLGS